MSGSEPSGGIDLEAENATNASGKVERIRDIVFGSQMREYNQRFDALERDITRMRQDLSQFNEQLTDRLRQISTQLQEAEERQLSRLQDSGRKLDERIDELNQQQTDKMHNLNDRLTQSLEEQNKRLGERIHTVNLSAENRLDQIQNQLRQIGEELRAELRENTAQLTDSKMERTTLGELLIEMGTSLREESYGGMLDDLIDNLANEAG
ncbi:MAG: hypothetical protein KDD92_09630 [Caldilineaceae bacterium]|nr:hypothetical protein [Caldilineaceae bacterium]